MNTTEAAFLADIAEHPDDDAPRLVFADWLEDNRRGPQGEFIRVQCELERLGPSDPRAPVLRGREAFLLSRYGKGWARAWLRRKLPRLNGSTGWGFRRGMIESLTLAPRTLQELGEEVFSRLPIRHLSLVGLTHLGELPAARALSQLNGLDLTGNLGFHTGDIVAFHRGNPLAGLRRLSLRSYRLFQENWRALVSGLAPGQLESIGLGWGSFWPTERVATLQAALADPCASHVHSLQLELFDEANVLADLCAMPGVGRLRDITLTGVNLEVRLRPEDRGILSSLRGAFRRRPSPGLERLLGGLSRLSLSGCSVSGSLGMGGLLKQAPLSNLHTLQVDGGSALGGNAAALTGPHLSTLTSLSLTNQAVGDAGLAAVTGSSTLSNLMTLDLSANGLTAEAVPLLIDSPAMSNLRWLSLRGNPIGGGLRRLVDSDLVERLVVLDLRDTRPQEEDVARLAASAGRLKGLQRLDLRKNPLSKPVRDRLSDAFKARVQYQG